MTTKAECQPWSRRCSTETIFSLQGRETDVVHDTSDTDSRDDGEWEPVDLEDEPDAMSESSGVSDTEIIKTKVIEVTVADDGDLQLADSELTAGSDEDLDSELDFKDYWKCARCSADNNNPLYRYCESCFKVRKNLFPPRPKRKTRLDSLKVPRTLSQDSGVESQELSQPGPGPSNINHVMPKPCKRRADSADRRNKRIKPTYSESDSDLTSDCDNTVSNRIRTRVASLTKTISDPSLSIENFGTKNIKSSIEDINKNTIDSFKNGRKVVDVNINGIAKEVLKEGEVIKEGVKVSSEKQSKIVSAEIAVLEENESKKVVSEKLECEKVDLEKSESEKGEKIEAKDVESTANKDVKKTVDPKDDLCIICCVEPKSGVFVHGRIAHICCCYRCAVKVWAKAKRCPICNCKVSNVLKAVVM